MKHNTKRTLGTIALIALISMSCMLFQAGQDSGETDIPQEAVQEEPEQAVEESAPEPEGETLRQWAVSATASSEYDNPDFSAFQATGQPDTTEECGDFPTTWASAERTGVDWLELMYEMPVYPEQVNIYQNNLPNQVVEVELLDTMGTYHTIYTHQPKVTNCPHILDIDITNADYQAVGVRVTIDQSILDPTSWNEIDAVELVGRYTGGEVAVMPPADSPPAEEPAEESAPSGDYELPDMSPSDAAPGNFYYEVVGADADRTVEQGILQYQNTSDEYVIGLISEDSRYSLSLMLPMEINSGPLPMIPYDSGSFSKSPTTAIYIGVHLFIADGGLFMFEDAGDTITGSFVFVAHGKDDPSRVVTVNGVFNQIPLVEE